MSAETRLSRAPMRILASGLAFPEGPVVLADGTLLVIEMQRRTLTRIDRSGKTSVVANFTGTPNGAAIGPDGAVWIANNGGMEWREHGGIVLPLAQPADYSGGRIERVNLATGKVELVYDRYQAAEGERKFRGLNDLVFDAAGGLWFTDTGKRRPRDMDRGGIFYAPADGSGVKEVVFPIPTPNGIGLSPDGKTVYAAETDSGRLWGWNLSAPGVLGQNLPFPQSQHGGRMLWVRNPYGGFDSLAVEAGGNVCVGAVYGSGGIAVVAPEGGLVEFVAMDDPFVTNICFGGVDMKTAWITASSSGCLIEADWPRAGLKLHFADRA